MSVFYFLLPTFIHINITWFHFEENFIIHFTSYRAVNRCILATKQHSVFLATLLLPCTIKSNFKIAWTCTGCTQHHHGALSLPEVRKVLSLLFNHGLSTALISSYSRTLCYESSFYAWFFHPHVGLPTYICPLELQKYANSCSPSWISFVCALQLIYIKPVDWSVAL